MFAPPAYDIIVLAASAGGLGVLTQVLSSLPPGFPAALAVVLHRSPSARSALGAILGRCSALPVGEAHPGERLRPGHVYIAPADRHLVVNPDQTFSTLDGGRISHVLSSADPLFASAAEVFGPRTLAVVLSGGDSDATAGVQAVRARGGRVIAQDPVSARFLGMPASAIRSGAVDFVLPAEEIGPALLQLVAGLGPQQAGGR